MLARASGSHLPTLSADSFVSSFDEGAPSTECRTFLRPRMRHDRTVGGDEHLTTSASSESWQERYSEICEDIRTTDDISFKLLGFVPLVSGIGIFAVLDLLGGKAASWPTTVFVSLFGATITYALFRWELRNIQICKWLRSRAEDLGRDELGLTVGPFPGRETEGPKFLGHRMRKETAEKLLYTATIVAWLSVPGITAMTKYL
jgi:hypothetical protein